MNILYICHYAGGLKYGMAFRPYYLAREWIRKGHRVRIITADFSHLRSINPHIEEDFSVENIDGIEYQWIKAGKYSGNSVRRALSMFCFVGKIWLKAKRIEAEFLPDVVISSSTYPLDTYAAQRIKKMRDARHQKDIIGYNCNQCVYIHEGHDLWPLTLTEIGGMDSRHPFVKIMGMAERAAYRNADGVVSILPNTLPHIIGLGRSPERPFIHIPNGIVADDWQNVMDIDSEIRFQFDRLRQQGKFIVLYLGGHAISNALSFFVEAARLLRNDERFSFVLVGQGTEKRELEAKVKELMLRNVFFFPSVYKSQVPLVLSLADVLYVGARRCSIYRFGVSMNKVYDYMMAAKPIIYGVDAYNNEVNKSGCGIVIPPENPEAIVKAIYKLYDMDYKTRFKMGEKGKNWVLNNAEYKILGDVFCKFIHHTMGICGSIHSNKF